MLSACSQSKKAQQSGHTTGSSTGLIPGYEVSPLTKAFLKDLQKALDSTGTTLNSFEPPAPFAKKHALIKAEGMWLVAGLMKTSEGFNQEPLKDKGISAGSLSGNIVTVRVPLAALPQFLHTSGITYFEKIVAKANK